MPAITCRQAALRAALATSACRRSRTQRALVTASRRPSTLLVNGTEVMCATCCGPPRPARARRFAPNIPAMATRSTPRKNAAAAQNADPAARVLRRFRLVFNAVKTHFRAVETQAGVSGAQLWALSVVQAQPGIGVSELARALDIHQSTASNLLRVLVDKGFVAADRGGTDRRSVQLTVTPRGVKLLAKAPGPFAGVLPEALSRLDARTLARLDRDLAKVIEQLGADERGAGIPLGNGD